MVDSLELELSGELVLSLLELLSAPHVLVVHVLDLHFDCLELGVQLDETTKTNKREERSDLRFPVKMNWSTTRCSSVAHSNSTGGTGVW